MPVQKWYSWYSNDLSSRRQLERGRGRVAQQEDADGGPQVRALRQVRDEHWTMKKREAKLSLFHSLDI